MRIAIIFVFLAILGVSLIAGLYFFYEKPVKDEVSAISTREVILRSLDNDKQVSIEYDVILDSQMSVFASGETSSDSFVVAKVPYNHTFTIFSRENDIYYPNRFFTSDFNSNLVRVEFPLIRKGQIEMNKSSLLGADNPIMLTVNSGNGTFQYTTICVRWSSHIIYADIFGVERGEPPQRLTNKVDRCFYTKQPVIGAISFPVSYTYFDTLDDDFLEFYVIDGVLGYDGQYHVENATYSDVGILDMRYVIE